MCNRITNPERAEPIAAALSVPLTPAAQAWRGVGDAYPKRDVLVAATWRGERMLGVGHWGVRDPEGDGYLHNARLESIGGKWWGMGFPCAVIATAWWHTEWMPTRTRYDTINANVDRSPFAILARGKIEDGRLHVALISHEGGGGSLYHPRRLPYTVALADAFKTPAEVPATWLEFATSGLLDSQGRPWTGEVEKDRIDLLMETAAKLAKKAGRPLGAQR